jgi:hypothetical protein
MVSHFGARESIFGKLMQTVGVISAAGLPRVFTWSYAKYQDLFQIILRSPFHPSSNIPI